MVPCCLSVTQWWLSERAAQAATRKEIEELQYAAGGLQVQQYWQRVVCWKGFTGTPGQSYPTMQMHELWRLSFPLLAGLTTPVALLNTCHITSSSFPSYQAQYN